MFESKDLEWHNIFFIWAHMIAVKLGVLDDVVNNKKKMKVFR